MVALDTEFLRERTYRARLCLVQLATKDDIWLIDAAVQDDLTSVSGLLSDPSVQIVVHAGKQDLQIFHDAYGVLPRNVFDVQIAAGFAGLGASLPYGRLVSEVLGVRLEKGESYTDWCTRPLTSAQLSYAADDVRYLIQAADLLKAQLSEMERMGWVEEEMAALQTDSSYTSDPGDAWRRVGGRGSLSGRQAAVLKEVCALARGSRLPPRSSSRLDREGRHSGGDRKANARFDRTAERGPRTQPSRGRPIGHRHPGGGRAGQARRAHGDQEGPCPCHPTPRSCPFRYRRCADQGKVKIKRGLLPSSWQHARSSRRYSSTFWQAYLMTTSTRSSADGGTSWQAGPYLPSCRAGSPSPRPTTPPTSAR